MTASGAGQHGEFMELMEFLRRQVAVANDDAEFRAAIAGAGCSLALEVARGGRLERMALAGSGAAPFVLLRADAATWRNIALPDPPVGLHSFTAASRNRADFAVDGSPLHIAQALHALERFFEILRGQVGDSAAAGQPDLRHIQGAYGQAILDDGIAAQIYYERSGNIDAPVLLMLHTAGADARQFHPVMADPALQLAWNMVAFDMPSHGRSMPLPGALWQDYRLKKKGYFNICQAFIEQVLGRPAVLMGCSMGAAMALKVATDRPDLVAGVIALEAPLRAVGRRTALLAHPQVNQAAHNPSYVRGLMSPLSSLHGRRTAAWIYSQGGYQVYSGDLAFYSEEFDASIDLQGLDGTGKGIALLTGSYDYSATPADSRAVAALIPGARFIEMPELGHFPMIENPARLLAYIKPELDYVRSRWEDNA